MLASMDRRFVEKLKNKLFALASRKGDRKKRFSDGVKIRDEIGARPLDTISTRVAIAAIIRNEADYVREWIEFHLLVGVSQFYIYDNGSDDDLMSVLDPYVTTGIVRVTPWKGFLHQVNTQNLAYAHAVANVSPDIGWIALIDVDEFLFSPTGASLVDVLTAQPPHAAIAVKRVDFGPGEHIRRPKGLVIDSYRLRSNQFDHLKSIVRPWAVTVVATHRCKCDGPYLRPDPSVLRLNHYFTRSREEFEAKIRRGYDWNSDRAGKIIAVKQARYSRLLTEPVPDGAILVFLDELTKRMARWS
jgi:hypothetical protein